MRMLVLIALSVASLAAQQPGSAQVTYQDLLKGLADPTKWLTYSGTYDGHRHSPLTQITPSNVQQLATQWTF
jgi:alcohol dehydrogenase (cytochrome c)